MDGNCSVDCDVDGGDVVCAITCGEENEKKYHSQDFFDKDLRR